MYHLKSKDWIIEPVAISVPAVRGSIISAKATAINPKLMQWAHSGFLSHSVLLFFSVNCSSNQRMRPAQLIDQLLRELTKSPELPVQPLVQAFLCGVWVTLRKGCCNVCCWLTSPLHLYTHWRRIRDYPRSFCVFMLALAPLHTQHLGNMMTSSIF